MALCTFTLQSPRIGAQRRRAGAAFTYLRQPTVPAPALQQVVYSIRPAVQVQRARRCSGWPTTPRRDGATL